MRILVTCFSIALAACPDDDEATDVTSDVSSDGVEHDDGTSATPDVVTPNEVTDAADVKDATTDGASPDAPDGVSGAPVVTGVWPELVKICGDGSSDVLVIHGSGFPADPSAIRVTWASGAYELAVEQVTPDRGEIFCHMPASATAETAGHPLVIETAGGQTTTSEVVYAMPDQGLGCTPAETYGTGLLCRLYALERGVDKMPALVGPDGCGAPLATGLDADKPCPLATFSMSFFEVPHRAEGLTWGGPVVVDSWFGVRCEGQLAIPDEDPRSFQLCSRGGSLLWLAPTLDRTTTLSKDDAVLDHDGIHAASCIWTQLTSRPQGLYDIVLDFFQPSADDIIFILYWRASADAEAGPIPWEYFVPPPELTDEHASR